MSFFFSVTFVFLAISLGGSSPWTFPIGISTSSVSVISLDFSKKVSFGINGTFSSYSTHHQEEAWNLPSLKLGSNLNVIINKKWYAGANVFFVGERKDIVYIQSSLTIFPPIYYPETTDLKSYFDANLHVGYKHSERLTGFLKLNNIGNQAYQRWLNYPVQGFQVVLGANYKFDF